MLRLMAVVVAVGGCAADDAAPDPSSVRDRLATGPASLAVAPTPAAGHITVRRRMVDGWQASTVDLDIVEGDLALSADGDGGLTVEQLDLALGPYELDLGPGTVELVDIRARLVAPVRTEVAWTDANAATATLPAALHVSWSIAIDGHVSPLSDLWPPAMPLAIELAGDATRVDARVELAGEGALWSWAELVELADLSLAIDARL